MNKNTNVVFFGTTVLSADILEQLIQGGYKVVAVITSPDKPVGRKQILTPSPVSAVADKHGLLTLKPTKLNQAFIEEHRAELTADLYLIAAYGKIIPQVLLDIPLHGTLNVHGSILPKYRGASPIQAAILNGDQSTGVTIMLVDAEMDHGDTLSESEILISKSETFASLEQKMAQAGGELLIETIPGYLDGSIKPQAQNHARASFCPLIKKEDGFFEIDSPPPPEKLDRMIRAYYPWPNVWTRWNGKVVKFYPEEKMQLEGKKIVSKEEFLRGHPDFPEIRI